MNAEREIYVHGSGFSPWGWLLVFVLGLAMLAGLMATRSWCEEPGCPQAGVFYLKDPQSGEVKFLCGTHTSEYLAKGWVKVR